MKTSDVLRKALKLLGPNGENWIRCGGGTGERFCLGGAVANVECGDCVKMYDGKAAGLKALFDALPPAWLDEKAGNWKIQSPEFVWKYNDHENTQFKHVRALFHKAIRTELAKERATQNYLESLDACQEARAWVGEQTLEQAWNACTRLDWLQWLVTAAAYAEYKRVTAAGLAEYRRVKAPALADYDRVRAAAWAEYKRVRDAAHAEYQRVADAAYAEYQRVTAPAYAEYQRVEAPAWAEYKRVRAAAWAEYQRVTAPALAEYKRVTAPARDEYDRATAAAYACKTCDELREKFECPNVLAEACNA